MSSTFAGVYKALSGIQTSQLQLQVTGQNMTNVSTNGYTRQRADVYSVGSSGNNMRYASTTAAVGAGVMATGVSQLRDPYLDIRFRSENAKVGDTTTQLSAMSDIENVLDEVKTDGLEAQMKALVSQLQNLCEDAGNGVSESTVKTSASILVNMFNNYSEQLSSIRNQQKGYLKDNAVNKVNQLIGNISHLSEEIRMSEISGSSALELEDQRNSMLDERSQYVNIEIQKNSVDIGSGRTVDELSVYLVGASGTKHTLINNEEYAKFGFGMGTSATTGKECVNVTLTDLSGSTKTINSELSTGVFHGYLKILNENGEYDAGFAVIDPVSYNPTGETSSASGHGIGYYQLSLDTLAQKLAAVMNAANSTNTENKPLFASSVAGEQITASNIALSSQWENSTGAYITTTKQPSGVEDNSKATDNILAMIKEFSTDIDFQTENGVSLFTGTFQEFVTNLSNTLGLEQGNISSQNNTYSTTLATIDKQRLSVSSVDINEEGINLIMYNQAMTAACRFMTTLDESLDNVISKMGIVGR